ncbi:ATP-dependent DNA helicase II subunit 2 [Aspergillus tubingensis]|uniref:ATP-dependent DNA helicase II subunit 2 n=1 Tax=Aspergillus tubingensis TaxID=5068 RepID=A0A8H3Y0W6_ASPTU|nr:ATP-dependent DNA helicase II subunit 2 [Aspergillus tubingensis]GFN17841.1 ATP-dependent DNA helicase II subunit 2 [Aspergillus tubingensis]GLA64812.1 ATP-dependent DNA helicase II subunit 2 [Aspergillus tubingensis]GLA83505.1 ATP-dependent DNA helicase II subunit 2 [Aspergillus tubingensis]GLA90932.1 ATP-dependent DNA helicase II subunit 2 [Aspergillus tubingensis]GLB14146.1 ATP-dependent DNA helicase II subunit 2 [Aspergillus tubingensis]
MADKEATVYIVDCGKSMGERRHGREVTDLDWAMQYVWDRITGTVATGRKMALIGALGLRTDDTANELEDDSDYSHISVLSGIKQFLMPDIRSLSDRIKPSKTNKGDAISALVLAIQMIITQCKKLKYKRRIVLVTNGQGPMNPDNLSEITKKIKEDNIELIILGPDFDDPDYGVKEEDKDPRKAENEALLRSLAEDCDGAYGTLEQAVAELETPRVKSTRITASFKGHLQLGNPAEYDTAVRIPVERYYRTYVAKAPSASQFTVRTEEEMEAAGAGSQDGSSLVGVRNSRSYQIDDGTTEDGVTTVDRDQLAKGYEYGRTLVPISETDENITTLETFAAIELLGFIQSDRYDRYMHMSTTNIIIAQRANDKAALALSSFIHALFELESYAVARMVLKENKPPVIVVLAPSIEPDYECLLEAQLPFAEDVRTYRFPPLNRVVTVSGKVVTQHRNLPSDDLLNAMDKYVKSMELTDTDENGDPTESLPIDDSFSPVLHRIDSAVRHRAIHPNDPIPPPAPVLTKFSHPPDDLVEKSKKYLDKLVAVSDVKKVPPKTKGTKRSRETEKPLSGLDVDALLHQEKRTKISPNNAIPEFKQTLSQAENIDTIKDAVKQMSTIIEDQIRHSLGDVNYPRVAEGLVVMREELIDYEEPALYNDFLKQLKEKLLKEELGGDRRELWWLLRRSKLGLIDKGESDRSEVEEEEAKAFISMAAK